MLLVLGGLWLHPYSFILVIAFLIGATLYEYYSLVSRTNSKPQIVFGIICGLLLYMISILVASGVLSMNYFFFLIPCLILLMIAELYRKQENPFDSLAHTFFGIIYISVPFSLFPFVAFGTEGISSILPYSSQSFSPGIIIGFFVLLWSYDVSAYFIGSLFGKHRLFKRLSPKKSWEGFIAGVVFSALISIPLHALLGVFNLTDWLIISLIISITGTFGDLVESMLKRSAGLKDSGSILPGHGGFLDRFDSTLISFPFVYIYITLFG